METDQVRSGEPVPPPVSFPEPPPVTAAAREVEESPAALWRWNDRLAIVAGCLTLVLIGVFAGRIFGPSSQDDAQLASAAPLALESATTAEVNPPELAVTTEPSVPAVAEVTAAPTPEMEEVSVVEASVPAEPVPTQVAVVPAPPAAEETAVAPPQDDLSSEASKPVEEAQPVSVEGVVATIRVPPLAPVCAAEKKFKDRKLNTSLEWAESGNAAAQQAEEEKKLVFLIHVSGNFEVPGFT